MLLVRSLIRHECIIDDSELITNTFQSHSNAVVSFLISLKSLQGGESFTWVHSFRGHRKFTTAEAVQSLVVGARDI